MTEELRNPLKPCPICGEMIDERARKCRFCNEWLTQYPVVFERGRERIWGASFADIRSGAGSIRVSPDGLHVEGQLCPGFAIVSTTLEATQGACDHPVPDVERVVHVTDKRRLLIGIRRPGAWVAQWYQCASDRMQELVAALREVLPPERVTARLSTQNAKMAQDLGLNWSIAAALLPIPFLGCLLALAALVFSGLGVARAKSVVAWISLVLAVGASGFNGWIVHQIITH